MLSASLSFRFRYISSCISFPTNCCSSSSFTFLFRPPFSLLLAHASLSYLQRPKFQNRYVNSLPSSSASQALPPRGGCATHPAPPVCSSSCSYPPLPDRSVGKEITHEILRLQSNCGNGREPIVFYSAQSLILSFSFFLFQ